MKNLLLVVLGILVGLLLAFKTNENIRLEMENERIRAENADLRIWLEINQPKMESLDRTFQAVLLDTNHYQWQLFDRTPRPVIELPPKNRSSSAGKETKVVEAR